STVTAPASTSAGCSSIPPCCRPPTTSTSTSGRSGHTAAADRSPSLRRSVEKSTVAASRNAWSRREGGHSVRAAFDDQTERGRGLAAGPLQLGGQGSEPDATRTASEYEIAFGAHRYPFYVGEGPHAWSALVDRLAALDADRFAVVTEPGVPPHFAQQL